VATNPLLCRPADKQTIEIANQAEVVDYLADFVEKGRNRITESDVFAIHWLTIKNIYPCAGEYRTALMKMKITGTTHKPSPPFRIRSDVRDMLEWLVREGCFESPIHKASYVLWKTNAIHPFSGGNGRVARALAYLVIVINVAPLFAGESLPSKLKARKAEYIGGLKAADGGDLTMLEQMVGACVQEQINEISNSTRE
jgi:Fic family protein